AGHSAATARHVYEDELHLSASNREEDEGFIKYLYNKFCVMHLGDPNGKAMYDRLQAGELCYFDTLAAFDRLNKSITLLYTNCATGAFYQIIHSMGVDATWTAVIMTDDRMQNIMLFHFAGQVVSDLFVFSCFAIALAMAIRLKT
ncbi:30416_t:CDS:2, partial [Gigaspora margarita]